LIAAAAARAHPSSPVSPQDLLIIPLIEMMHNTKVWNEPSKFDPDRFESETQEMKDAYLPFGLGARNCYGDKMAKTEIKYCSPDASQFRML